MKRRQSTAKKRPRATAPAAGTFKVYHGTDTKFTKVNLKKVTDGIFWFSSDRAKIARGEAGAQGIKYIMPLEVTVKKPAGWDEYENYYLDQLRQLGYDGVILPEADGTFDGFVWNAAQIKLLK